ncbi:MAG TPA: TRAM domain-containing protein [Jatrophihabitantaceae bacterium]|nr:TRAM domain-containing protein [Jatrophihabitantaceae bacterium]
MTDWSGRLLEVEVGAPGHGGFCVARADGRVVFVRHALPGERVRALVTEDAGGSFCRADAVEVLTASADRVAPPCPHAGPGRCGGCDWQHSSGPAQRALKAAVVREQFARLAGLEVDLDTVEELPGGLLGWRTRVLFAVDPQGRTGLHRHRSHDIEPLTACPLGVAGVAGAPHPPDGVTGIEAAVGDADVADVTVLAHRPGPGRQARGQRPPDQVQVVSGPERLRHRLGERAFEVSAAGFWQVHPDALSTFAAAVLAVTAPRPGETALDLYAGAGPLTAVLADAVGATGRVLGIESSRQAVADAAENLADLPWARVEQGRITPDLLNGLDFRPDVVVMDPPRAGAGAAVMAAVLGRNPRCVAYLSCDPATLARDVRAAVGRGWRLRTLRAFDAFPMTSHVECLALLVPDTAAGVDVGRYTDPR